jgi:hypothetical protein
MKRKRVNREVFSRWLQDQKGVVGYSRRPYNCPIINFFHSWKGYSKASIGIDKDDNYTITKNMDSELEYLPVWMNDLIKEIDKKGYNEEVTAYELRTIYWKLNQDKKKYPTIPAITNLRSCDYKGEG